MTVITRLTALAGLVTCVSMRIGVMLPMAEPGRAGADAQRRVIPRSRLVVMQRGDAVPLDDLPVRGRRSEPHRAWLIGYGFQSAPLVAHRAIRVGGWAMMSALERLTRPVAESAPADERGAEAEEALMAGHFLQEEAGEVVAGHVVEFIRETPLR